MHLNFIIHVISIFLYFDHFRTGMLGVVLAFTVNKRPLLIFNFPRSVTCSGSGRVRSVTKIM